LFWIDTLREATKFCKRVGGKDMRLDIKVAIVKSGRKQYEIAQELGVPESTLSKYVRGYGVLSQDHATKLAQLIGLEEEVIEGAGANHDHTANTI
jgi:predicted transcriptional regulator